MDFRKPANSHINAVTTALVVVELRSGGLDFNTDFDFKKIEMSKLKYELSDLDPTLLTC